MKKAIVRPDYAEVEYFRWAMTDPIMMEVLREQKDKMASLNAAYDNDGLFDFGVPDGDGPGFLSRLADQYANAGARFLTFGVGSCFAWNFRPRVMEAPWAKDEAWDSACWKQVREYMKAGTDPLTYILEQAHRRNLLVFANFRFNRYHLDHSPPLTDTWFIEHPNYHLSRKSCPWVNIPENPWPVQNSINLAFPEAREHMVSNLIDVVENYPVEGLQLELQRAVPFFELDEPDKFEHMNTFVRMLREELDRIGKKRGGKIKLAFWLPTEAHHRILRSMWPDRFFGDEVWGLDPETWIDEGLVDYLIPSLFSVDWSMEQPVDMPAWVQTARDKGTKVHGCCMNLLPKKFEERTGEKCSMILDVLKNINKQCDGLFLFNTSPFDFAEILYLADA